MTAYASLHKKRLMIRDTVLHDSICFMTDMLNHVWDLDMLAYPISCLASCLAYAPLLIVSCVTSSRGLGFRV